jgi:hypothetical protein
MAVDKTRNITIAASDRIRRGGRGRTEPLKGKAVDRSPTAALSEFDT